MPPFSGTILQYLKKNLDVAQNNNNNNSQSQWNLWQQYQWPYVQPEQNRWSKSLKKF